MSVYRLDELPPHQVAPGVEARFMHGAGITLMRAVLSAGARVPGHRHPHEQVTTVLAGCLRITIAGQDHLLQPGTTAFVPGNVEHSALAEADTEVLDVFTPVREDYRVLGGTR